MIVYLQLLFFLWIKLVSCLLRESKVVFKNPDQDYIQELTFSKALESALRRRDINKSPIVRDWENNNPVLPTCLNLSFLPCDYAVPSSHEWVLHVDCFGQCLANRSLKWACPLLLCYFRKKLALTGQMAPEAWKSCGPEPAHRSLSELLNCRQLSGSIRMPADPPNMRTSQQRCLAYFCWF